MWWRRGVGGWAGENGHVAVEKAAGGAGVDCWKRVETKGDGAGRDGMEAPSGW